MDACVARQGGFEQVPTCPGIVSAVVPTPLLLALGFGISWRDVSKLQVSQGPWNIGIGLA